MPRRRGDWSVGRTRHVRLYLNEHEHALLRQAAALADLPLSQFSVEAVVEAARKLVLENQKATKATKGGK